MQRYTFPATDKANVLLNAGQSLHKTSAHQGRDPRQPHRAHRHHRQRLLPGHQAVHRLHDHPLRPALHHVRHLERRQGHRGLEAAPRATGATAPTSASTPPRTVRSRRPRPSPTSTRTGAARQPPCRGRPFLRRASPRAARRTWEDRLDDVRAQGRQRDSCAGPSTRPSTARSSRRTSAATSTAATRAGTRRSTAPRASPTTRTGPCGTPTAPRPSCCPCSRRASPATWRISVHQDRRGERLAAQVGLRHGRDEHHDRRPGHPVPHQRLPAGPAQGVRGAGLPGAEEERRRGAARRLAAPWAARPTRSTSPTASRRTSRAARM